MQAKLFMIPWIIKFVVSQRVPPLQTPTAETLTNELLVDAHQRHFYEMLRRQQQLNDALLRNNALLHIPRLAPPLPPPAPFFNPFIHPVENQGTDQGSTSKLGTYDEGKEGEVEVVKDQKDPEDPEEKEGTVEAPSRADLAKKSLAGVKTVSIQRKGEVEDDSEVVRLLKKLSLSKEEQNGIVKHMEQLVREELLRKLTEVEAKKETTTTTTTEAPTTTTTTTTVATTTSEPEEEESILEEEVLEEETTTIVIPKLQIRSEEKNVTLLRNNLKLHPIKLSPEKLDELEEEDASQGSIKTSLTHLPIIVANEEEDVTQKVATLHKRIQGSVPPREPSRDVLVDFATGAPLDLSEGLVTRQKASEPLVVVTSTSRPTTVTIRQSIGLPRQTHHEVTNFERLATDYRARLENTGDIHKILQKISENAYISLVERGGGPRKLFGA